MQNINTIERNALEHGVVGTVRKNIIEGQHRKGAAYIAGRIVGYALLLSIIAGIGYILLNAVGVI
jgi:hypothetical protein